MPTLPRHPAAQQEPERFQARRLRAAELFAVGIRKAEVTGQLSVSASISASTRAGGRRRRRAVQPSADGADASLSDFELRQVEQVLSHPAWWLSEWNEISDVGGPDDRRISHKMDLASRWRNRQGTCVPNRRGGTRRGADRNRKRVSPRARRELPPPCQ